MSEAPPPPDSSTGLTNSPTNSPTGGDPHEARAEQQEQQERTDAPSSHTHPDPEAGRPVLRDPGMRDPGMRDPGMRAAAYSTRPSAPRRPRYLVVALALSLIMGAGLWTEGCSTLSFYRGETDYKAVLNAQIREEANRARADERYEHFTEVADAARNRVIPLAAAIFVLGASMLVLSSLGLGGRRNTRHALVQVVGVQAAVVLAQYYLTKDVRMAKLDWQLESVRIQQQEALPPEEFAKVAPGLESARQVYGPFFLLLQTTASGLVLLALTRRRSREFFDMTANPAQEG